MIDMGVRMPPIDMFRPVVVEPSFGLLQFMVTSGYPFYGGLRSGVSRGNFPSIWWRRDSIVIT